MVFLGTKLPNWKPSKLPTGKDLVGNYCYLKRLDCLRDAKQLFMAFSLQADNWDFLPYGAFENLSDFTKWLHQNCTGKDPFFYTIFNKKNQALGMASYLRMSPEMGVIEVGHIHFSAILQKTTAATEAMYLLARHIFEDLGYRRYEWKCNNLNENSKKAALRLGFQLEGVFRQSAIYKGRNRDTAWFSILDKEWSNQKKKFENWLAPSNFDNAEKQKKQLSILS